MRLPLNKFNLRISFNKGKKMLKNSHICKTFLTFGFVYNKQFHKIKDYILTTENLNFCLYYCKYLIIKQILNFKCMKAAIIGYGKMGKEIEKILIERGHEISHILDIEDMKRISAEELAQADVAVEFTRPEAAYDNYLKCFEADIPVVSGTTGWLDKLDDIKNICKSRSKTLFYAPNFSIGVNLFFKLNTFLAQLMNPHSDYDVSISETHHTEKLDAPSGTAIKIAEDILKISDTKTNWKLGNKEQPQTIAIEALRKVNVPGIHTVKYESAVDEIEITHRLKNRKSLALGAVLAAEYAIKNTGFLTMDNLLTV